MAASYSVFIVFSLLNVCAIQSFTWSTTSLPDHQQLYACAGDNVTLTWNYTLSPGEELGDVQWLYNGQSQEVVAISTRGVFLPTPSFSQRVTWVDNAGLTLSKVLVADSGNYSVEVNVYRKEGTLHTLLRRTATIHVSEHMFTTDGALHIVQNPDPVYNNATGQWFIQLQCGHFIFLEDPPFHLEWTTPSGSVYNSTSFSQGNFYFHIPMPVETGNYVCSIPTNLLAYACLHGHSQSRVAVKVDSMEARLLLEHQLARAQAEVTQQQDINNRQQSLITQLQMEISQLNSTTSNYSQQLQQILDAERNQVAFHAFGIQDLTSANRTVMMFDHVVYNLGNAYSSSTGYFTAPYPGLYFFISKWGSWGVGGNEVHVLEADVGALDYAFYHNSADYVNTNQPPIHGVVHLRQGQRVYVSIALPLLDYRPAFSSFTGFMLSRDQ